VSWPLLLVPGERAADGVVISLVFAALVVASFWLVASL
jgi:hypothetical protein